MVDSMDRTDLHKHLDFIQNVIARLANNSFLMKGWTLTVSGAFFGLAAKESSPEVAAVGLLPAAVFWGLDAYYLRQERLFRGLYDLVAQGSQEVGPFSMDARVVLKAGQKKIQPWARSLFTRTIGSFHGFVVVVGMVVICATR